MNKIETIYNAFNDIKDILGIDEDERCVTIEDLPGLVADAIANNGGYTTVFLFSGSSVPGELPINATMGADGRLSDTGEGWSQDSYETMATYSRSASNIASNWMSFARFNPDGTQSSPWSTPVDLKGADGRDGKDGVPGPEGPAGSQGNPGKDGADGTRFEYIYRLTNTDEQLDPPHSANEDGYIPEGWSDEPQGVSDDNEYEWVCQREKTNGTWGTWTTPSVWAHFGKVGKDGNGIEYIFCLTETEEQPEEPFSDPDKSESEILNYFPIEVGKWTWTDEPGETTDKIPYCWVSVRKQRYNDNGEQKWTPYSNATIWAKYARDGKEGGGRTVQVYTYDVNGDVKIPAPIGGAWDPESNAVTCPLAPEGDSHIWIDNMGLIPSKSEDGKLYHIWQSNGVFNSAGGQTSEGWSEPHRITGADGEPGKDGTSIEFIYRLIPDKVDYNTLVKWHTDQAELGNVLYSPENLSENDIADNWTGTPSKIDISNKYEGEGWTPIEGTGQYTICDTEWKDSPDGVSDNYLIEVCCQRKYNNETEKWGPWSMPYIWSMWGEDGIDGDGVEYIYMVTPKYGEDGKEITKYDPMLKVPTYQDYINYDKEYNAINGEGASKLAELYQEREFVPGVTGPNFIGFNEWSDEPVDVSESEPVEWVKVRKYRVHDGETEPRWGDFSEPAKWATWSTDGASFKTSYVFTVSAFDLSKLDPRTNLVGGDYNDPKPKDCNYTHNGKTYTISWTDAPRVPSEGEFVWMTCRTFQAGDKDPNDVGSVDRYWSVPTKLSDTSTFQVEFTRGYRFGYDNYNPNIIPEPVSFNTYCDDFRKADGSVDYDAVENKWRNVEKNKGFEWADHVADAVWMATSTFTNGKWSEWSVVKVKGEKGDAGKDGTSVTIEGLAVKWNNCDIPSEKQKVTEGLNEGKDIKYLLWDCETNGELILLEWYDPDENGVGQYNIVDKSRLYNGFGVMIDSDLWVWDGDSWENVGQIKGDVGDKTYLYIAHSDDPAVLTIDNVEDPESVEIYLDKVGKYIGYYCDFTARNTEFLLDPTIYTWSKWVGDDGWGWEQIFLLTRHDSEYKYDNPPAKPSVSEQVQDYLPDHVLGEFGGPLTTWSDVPQEPNATWPYCWTTRRTASTNEWGTEWEPVTLYSRYVANATHLELSEDHISIPITQDGEIDNEWNGADFAAYVYDGDDLRTDDKVKYYYQYNVDWIENTNEDRSVFELNRDIFVEIRSAKASKIRVKAIVEVTSEIKKEFTKDLYLTWTTSGYELTTSKHILTKNVYDGGHIIDSDSSVTVKVFKWDFDKNVYKPIKDRFVYVDVEYQNGATESRYSNKTNDDGITVFDGLRDLDNPSNLKFYITKEIGNEILAFENVGVVANGEDGASEEHIFYLYNKLVTNFSNVDWFTPEVWEGIEGYQTAEWTPIGWYDEYHDEGKDIISLEKPYLYASARKKTKNEEKGEMVWGRFQTPVLWAKYSKDATYAKFNKPAVIVSYLNDELKTTEIYNTLTVYKDKNDDTEIVVENVTIAKVTCDDVETNGLVSLDLGKSGVDEDVNLCFTINQSEWKKLSQKECNIDVTCKVDTKTGEYTATFEIFITKAGGESKFSIDLSNEFFYLLENQGTVDINSWPDQKFYAYYGGSPIGSVTRVNVTANGVDLGSKSFDVRENDAENEYELEIDKSNLLPLLNDSNVREIRCIVTATALINEKEFVTKDEILARKDTNLKPYLNVTPSVCNLIKEDQKITWSIEYPSGNKVDGLTIKVLDNGSEVATDVFEYMPTVEGDVTIQLYDGTLLLDQESVMIVKLTNPYMLDINPDTDWVVTDSEGKPNETFEKVVTITLWNGNQKVSGVKYNAEANGCYIGDGTQSNLSNIETLKIRYTADNASTEDAAVKITCTYNEQILEKTYTLKKSLGKATYEIVVPNQVNADSEATVNIQVKRVDGNNIDVLTTNGEYGELRVNYGTLNQNPWSYTIDRSISVALIQFEFVKNGIVLDTEYITIVRNGALDASQIQGINDAIAQAKEDTLKEAENNINTAKVELDKQLSDAKTTLENAIADGDRTAIQKANEAYQNAQTLDSALKALQTAHNNLSGEVDGVKSSVLSENQVKQLSVAALTDKTYMTDDVIGSQTVIGQQIIGLAGTFAKIDASQINSGYIDANRIAAQTITADKIAIGTDLTDFVNVDTSGFMTEDEVNDAIVSGTSGFLKSGDIDALKNTVKTINENYISSDDVDDKIDAFVNAIPDETDWNTWFDGLSNISGTKIADGTISTEKLTALQIDAGWITSGQINSARINTDELVAKKVASSSNTWHLDDGGLYYRNSSLTTWTTINEYGADFIFSEDDSSVKTSIDGYGLVVSEEGVYTKIRPGSFSCNGVTINGRGLAVDDGTIISHGNIGTDGSISADGSINSSTGFFQTSDERFKTFHDDIEIDFEKLKSIPKKYFTWKDGDSKLQLGTSAQKVQALYPELVNDGDKLSVDYARLSMIALAAVDKLYDELMEVKKELNDLKNK